MGFSISFKGKIDFESEKKTDRYNRDYIDLIVASPAVRGGHKNNIISEACTYKVRFYGQKILQTENIELGHYVRIEGFLNSIPKRNGHLTEYSLHINALQIERITKTEYYE